VNVRDKLISVALDLFLTYGTKRVSMDDICKNLGISKKTIYNFVSNKEELVQFVIEDYLSKDRETISKISASSENAVLEIINITEHSLNFIKKIGTSVIFDLKKYHPEIWDSTGRSHFSFIEEKIHQNLLRGQNEQLYRMEFNPQVIAKLYVYMSNCVVDEVNFPDDQFNRITLFREMIMYHLYAVVTGRGKELILANTLK
jgi:AcrR family transcriptional regulator